MATVSLDEFSIVLIAALLLIGSGILQAIGNDIWAELKRRLRRGRFK